MCLLRFPSVRNSTLSDLLNITLLWNGSHVTFLGCRLLGSLCDSFLNLVWWCCFIALVHLLLRVISTHDFLSIVSVDVTGSLSLDLNLFWDVCLEISFVGCSLYGDKHDFVIFAREVYLLRFFQHKSLLCSRTQDIWSFTFRSRTLASAEHFLITFLTQEARCSHGAFQVWYWSIRILALHPLAGFSSGFSIPRANHFLSITGGKAHPKRWGGILSNTANVFDSLDIFFVVKSRFFVYWLSQLLVMSHMTKAPVALLFLLMSSVFFSKALPCFYNNRKLIVLIIFILSLNKVSLRKVCFVMVMAIGISPAQGRLGGFT